MGFARYESEFNSNDNRNIDSNNRIKEPNHWFKSIKVL